MNNNKLDEPALLAGCKGVFAKTSYITFGSKEKPEDYVKKGNERSNFGGKQLTTQPPKEGNTNDVYFEKKHNWISDGDKYADRVRYKDAQSEKKKGFLTSDFSKRDEFTNTIRTEQYREQLRGEGKFTKQALDLMAGALDDGMEFTQSGQADRGDDYFYDRVFEKEDPGFNGASKTHRDTKNRCNLSKDRAMGGQMTSTLLSYQAPTEFEKPEHARRPLVRDTFYRKTNIFFPSSVSADPA